MDQTTLKKIKEELDSHLLVSRVYLFGSRARGKAHEDSDYDIAVVSNDFAKMSFSQRQRLVRPLVRKVIGNLPLDVLCYTEDEYERGKKAFLPGIIEEEGIIA